MSLMRQLWIAVFVSAVIAFAGSLLVSIWSAQGYLTLQLARKNSDVASSLALSMSQQVKDPIMSELQVAALFDTGYYQRITVNDPFDKLITERKQDGIDNGVPNWFIELFPIESKPGLAHITDGWKQYGTVHVVSHTQFAYQALWEQANSLLIWFVVGGVGVGLLGMFWLRTIGRSLKSVVEQANAIGERRFVTIDEPRISELRLLTRAMNGMVVRVKQMFNETAGSLEELRRERNYDFLSGIPNRDYFMNHFKLLLNGEDAVHCGVLVVMRASNLNKLNEALGRVETDTLLKQWGQLFDSLAIQQEGALAGRIKAGEMAVLLPGESNAQSVTERVSALLQEHVVVARPELDDLFHLGAVRFMHGGNIAEVLAQVDCALALAEAKGANCAHVIEEDAPLNIIPGEQWRSMLTLAVRAGNIKLEFFPVLDKQGHELHQEGMVRLQQIAGQTEMMAGDFMPIAAHLNLTALIDLEVVRLAVQHLRTHPGDVAVNLSAKTIDNWTFRDKLSGLLHNYPDLCHRLWFEVAEYGAFKHFDAFKDICLTLKRLGCRVGVEQFGQHLSDSQKLTELGLDYVKIHASLVDDIEQNQTHQLFLQRFGEIAHALGMIVIAVGVKTESERAKLQALGLDGLTGPVLNRE